MRIVYDDAMQMDMVGIIARTCESLDVRSLLEYDNGTDRIQRPILKSKLNRALEAKNMFIGDTAEHAYGIGNNSKYPVYFRTTNAGEMQVCGYVSINVGLFGEAYVYCSDYNDSRISPSYEIGRFGVKKNT